MAQLPSTPVFFRLPPSASSLTLPFPTFLSLLSLSLLRPHHLPLCRRDRQTLSFCCLFGCIHGSLGSLTFQSALPPSFSCILSAQFSGSARLPATIDPSRKTPFLFQLSFASSSSIFFLSSSFRPAFPSYCLFYFVFGVVRLPVFYPDAHVCLETG